MLLCLLTQRYENLKLKRTIIEKVLTLLDLTKLLLNYEIFLFLGDMFSNRAVFCE